MLKFLFDMITGIDGESVDIGRVFFGLALLVFFFLSVWTVVVQQKPFEPASFGAGLAAIATGIGALLWMKKDTEPGQVPGKITSVVLKETNTAA